MSLRAALTSGEHGFLKCKNNIVTVFKRNPPEDILYSCFLCDIQIYHPIHGLGKVLSIDKNKWMIEFNDFLNEYTLKEIIHYLPTEHSFAPIQN